LNWAENSKASKPQTEKAQSPTLLWVRNGP